MIITRCKVHQGTRLGIHRHAIVIADPTPLYAMNSTVAIIQSPMKDGFYVRNFRLFSHCSRVQDGAPVPGTIDEAE